MLPETQPENQNPKPQQGHRLAYLLIGFIIITLGAIGVAGYFVVGIDSDKSGNDKKEVVEEVGEVMFYEKKDVRYELRNLEHSDTYGHVQYEDRKLVALYPGDTENITIEEVIIPSLKEVAPDIYERGLRLTRFSFPTGSQKLFFRSFLPETGAQGGNVYVYNVADGMFEDLEGVGYSPFSTFLSPDGRKIARYREGSLQVIDLLTNTEMARLDMDERESVAGTFEYYGGSLIADVQWLDNNVIELGVYDARDEDQWPRSLLEYRRWNWRDGSVEPTDVRTYRNEMYGIQFEYPKEWNISRKQHSIFSIEMTKNDEVRMTATIHPRWMRIGTDDFVPLHSTPYGFRLGLSDAWKKEEKTVGGYKNTVYYINNEDSDKQNDINQSRIVSVICNDHETCLVFHLENLGDKDASTFYFDEFLPTVRLDEQFKGLQYVHIDTRG